MTHSKNEFWVFSYSAGIGSKRSEEARWGLDVVLDRVLMEAIKRQDGPILGVPSLEGRADRSDRVEDVPFVYQDVYVVSDRVKRIFEDAGPTDCQFIQLDVRYQNEPIHQTYWVLHVLRTIDCADPAQSYNVPHRDGTPYYVRAAVVPSRVPKAVNTFRIANAGSRPVVRDSLKRAIQRAKVTGCAFYSP